MSPHKKKKKIDYNITDSQLRSAVIPNVCMWVDTTTKQKWFVSKLNL